jgi:hypothetical protein
MPDFFSTNPMSQALNGLNDLSSGLRNAIPSPISDMVARFGGNNTTRGVYSPLLPEYSFIIHSTEANVTFSAALPPDFDWSSTAEYDTPFRELIGSVMERGVARLAQGASGLARAAGLQLVTQALTAKVWTGSATTGISLPFVLQARTDDYTDVLEPLISLLSFTMPRLQGGKKGAVLAAPGPRLPLDQAVSIGIQNLQNVATRLVAGANNSGGILEAAKDAATGVFKAVAEEYKQLSAGDIAALSAKTSEAALKLSGGVDDFVRQHTTNMTSVQIGTYLTFPSVVIKDVQHKTFVQPVMGRDGVPTGNYQRIEGSVAFDPFTDLTFDDLAEIFYDERAKNYVRQLVAQGNVIKKS